MRKEWYKVTFYAKMSQEDVHALNKHLYEIMEGALNIDECSDLRIEEDEPASYNEPETDITLIEGDFELDRTTGDIILDSEVWLNILQLKNLDDVGKEIKIYFEDEDIDDPYKTYKVKSIDDSEIVLEYIA